MDPLGQTASALALYYHELELADARVKALKAMITPLEEQLEELFASSGIDSVKAQIPTLPDKAYTIYRKRALYASVPEEIREAAFAKFREIDDLAPLVKESIHAGSLAAWVKENFDPDKRLTVEEIDAAIPPDIRGMIKVSLVFSIGKRKA